jgi:dCTP deaminase
MILTDREIEIALAQKQIIIEPQPDLKEAISSTSLDLTLSDRFAEWQSRPGMPIRPGAPGYNYSSTSAIRTDLIQNQYELKSRHFVLAWTAEYVKLPLHSRIAARVEGKSSLARLGVSVHVTAPTIHSGFDGHIQLEMFNFGALDIILDRGMKVCQLIFEYTAGTPLKGYSGIFSGQTPNGDKA